jgi:hypothetical protein
MFRALGTPPEHKQHKLFDYGHVVPTHATAKHMLEWLDRYLGTVK